LLNLRCQLQQAHMGSLMDSGIIRWDRDITK